MKSDIEIAREVSLRKIKEVATGLGIPREEVQNYGRYIAKVPLHLIDEEKIKEHRFFCGQGKVLNRRGRQFIVFLLKHPAFAARRTFPTGNIMRDVFAIDLAQFLYAVDIRLIHLDDARRAAVACRFDASDGIGDNLLALLARRILD